MNKSISKLTISTPELVELHKNKLERLSKNKSYSKNAIDIGTRIYSNLGNLRSVTLEITPELGKRLASGELKRTNGILRHRDGRIFKHLKDAKPTKLKNVSRSLNIAFAGLTILEDQLVDQKLNEIVDIVTRIEEKLDARLKGKYKSAMDQFRELSTYENPENAKHRVSIILNELGLVQREYNELYKNKWRKYNNLKTRYQSLKKSKIKLSNKSVGQEMSKEANDLIDLFCLIISCKLSYVITKYYFEDDQASAQIKSYDLLEYAKSEIDKFEDEFGDDAIREIKKNYKRVISRNKWNESKLTSIEEELKPISSTSNLLLNQLIMTDLAAFPETEELPPWKT